VRFATYREQPGPAPARAGVVSDAGIHPLPPDVTVLDLVRAGLLSVGGKSHSDLLRPAGR
jgi:hypothetical protein